MRKVLVVPFWTLVCTLHSKMLQAEYFGSFLNRGGEKFPSSNWGNASEVVLPGKENFVRVGVGRARPRLLAYSAIAWLRLAPRATSYWR